MVHFPTVKTNPETLPPHHRQNFYAFALDYIAFGVAFTFFNPDSIIPGVVGKLTDSALMIGLSSAAFYSSWQLPQLAVARLINDKPRKMPYLLAGLTGRIAFLVIAVALWLGLGDNPTAMLALIFVCVTLFTALDSLSGVAWFDIMARALPPKLRGRMMGIAQVAGGLLGFGAGILIRQILDQREFPGNYALIFALATAALAVSAIGVFLIREPGPESKSHEEENGVNKKGWLGSLFANPDYCRVLSCRVLVGMLGLAVPFYVKHAGEVMGLPESAIGEFAMAQTMAGVVVSLALTPIYERWGARHVIRIGSAAAAVGPLFALMAHLIQSDGLARVYPIVFVSLGIINNVSLIGFLNYLMEIAPEGQHSAYVGTMNTMLWPLTLMGIVGGWLLEITSYTVLFGVTSAFVVAGFLISLGMKPSPRQSAS
jgi:Na+/melibiose symporter-like transporter